MISKSTAKRILLDSGAKRVSNEAAEALANHLNRLSYAIAGKAVKLAKHAKRKTVEKEDIELAKS
ncbi:MAG: NFYB/HAP3 family transcription factor subunit [Candidatus Micrarchaeaceae archaeon]